MAAAARFVRSSAYVSEDTVKTHLKRCYRKLGVGNRAQATSVVLRHTSFTGRAGA